MQQIRIKSIPPGEAPEAIRADWIDVVIPLPEDEKHNPRELYGVGVLSGPRKYIPQLWMRLRGKCLKWNAFSVDVLTAIQELEKRSPSSAQWWRTNTPDLMKEGKRFMFPEDICTLEEK